MNTVEDARRVLEQWNVSHDPVYRVRECDVRWNLTEQNLVDYETTEFRGTPSLVASATPAGVRAGISAKTMWVPLWGIVTEGAENDFVAAVLALGKDRHCNRVVFGADEFHFVPGIPFDEAGRRLTSAVRQAGFDGAEAFDFVGSLDQTEVHGAIDEALATSRREGWRFETAASEEDFKALEEFLLREFPGRWHREFVEWRSRKDTGRAFWNVLRLGDDEILGFARMAVRGRVTPIENAWTPGALRLALGQGATPRDDDGCLGPIGIAVSQRGKGAGRVLLGLVLQALRQNRANRICIDWTNALKYYEPLLFERARQYWTTWMVGPG